MIIRYCENFKTIQASIQKNIDGYWKINLTRTLMRMPEKLKIVIFKIMSSLRNEYNCKD